MPGGKSTLRWLPTRALQLLHPDTDMAAKYNGISPPTIGSGVACRLQCGMRASKDRLHTECCKANAPQHAFPRLECLRWWPALLKAQRAALRTRGKLPTANPLPNWPRRLMVSTKRPSRVRVLEIRLLRQCPGSAPTQGALATVAGCKDPPPKRPWRHDLSGEGCLFP